jgi:hypothetical protein
MQQLSHPTHGTIAAGPELLRDWRNASAPGRHPRGAALVAAAVDCRRAGMNDPVPRDLLEKLHHHYLLEDGGHTLRPEPVDEAWAWALHPVHGASSLLIPAGRCEDDQRYLAFDYLVDQPDHPPIPADTWTMLIDNTDQEQASHVAFEAFWHVRTAFHRAADSGISNDVFLQAGAVADRGYYSDAIQLLASAMQSVEDGSDDPQHRAFRHQIAFYQILSGRIDEAEASFKELLREAERSLQPDDEYLQVVRHNIAACTHRRGDLPAALDQFRGILSARERHLGPDAMNTLATRGSIANIIAELGDPAEALRLNRLILADEERALGRDHTNTFETRKSIATCLARTDDPGAAIETLQALLPDLARALGPDHPEVLDVRSDLVGAHVIPPAEGLATVP